MPTAKNIHLRTFPSLPIGVGEDTSLGNAKFSDASVDCGFLRSRSRWGSINDPSQDVGLLYLRICFYQPRDCRLRSVEAVTEFAPQAGTEPSRRPCIHVTYPGQICGQPREESVERNSEVRPHAEGAGFGGGIGGFFQKTNFKREYHWTFTMQRLADDTEYTKLAWKWEAPEKGESVAFERPIHAAVVVFHRRSTFTMRTRITGKFKSFRYGWRNLITRDTGGNEVSLTPDSSASPMDLTTLIEELEQAVEANNRQQAPTGKFIRRRRNECRPNASTEMPNFRQAV